MSNNRVDLNKKDEEYMQRMSMYQETKTRITLEEMKKFPEVTYKNYIRTDELLSLQNSDYKGGLHHHDEHLFIVTHQTFELWFKQVLKELDSVAKIFQTAKDGKLEREAAEIICHRLSRAQQILKHSIGAFDILETMHPADFLEFRDYIGPASGFQSVQMRELEITLGLTDKERVKMGNKPYIEYLKADTKGLERIKKRLSSPSLKDILYQWLEKVYDRIPEEFVPVFKDAKKKNLYFQKSLWYNEEKAIQDAVDQELKYLEPFLQGDISKDIKEEDKEAREKRKRRRVAALFINCYRHQASISHYANILDQIVGLEQAVLIWRSRHVRMVERMIGRRIGTGGSVGVGYLEKTLEYRTFQDLWEVRTHFIRETALPVMHLKK